MESLLSLKEILEVTAYEEIKTACIDAMKEIEKEEKSVVIDKT